MPPTMVMPEIALVIAISGECSECVTPCTQLLPVEEREREGERGRGGIRKNDIVIYTRYVAAQGATGKKVFKLVIRLTAQPSP